MNKERLLKLASELERCSDGRSLKVPQDGKISFCMGTWGSEAKVYKSMGYVGIQAGCGTVACAMGFAGFHPWFRKRGLKTDVEFEQVSYKGHSDFGAATAFFSIHANDAEYLFADWQYPDEKRNPTPKQVAKRIRKFVADHTA
jgi:hypothetical protein